MQALDLVRLRDRAPGRGERRKVAGVQEGEHRPKNRGARVGQVQRRDVLRQQPGLVG